MGKTPHVRHSQQKSEPVTLELEAVAAAMAEASGEAPAAGAHAVQAEMTENAADGPIDQAISAELAGDAAEAVTSNGPEADQNAPVQAARPKRGFGSLAFAGLLGGALALGGNFAVEYFGLPGQTAPQPDYAGMLAAQDARLMDAQADIDALKAALASVKGAGDTSGLTDQIKAFEARLAAAEQANAGVGGADPAALAALETRLTTLTAAAEAAKAAAANAETGLAGQGKRIDALDEAVKALKESAGSQAGNPQIARAIAAAALKSAIDRGLPFMAELETYAAVAPDAEEIAALRGLAASGVPTRADLAIELSQTAGAIIAAGKPANPDAGFIQNLIDSAKDLVEVRPIGAVDGEAPDAIVARMEAALKGGDLAKALAEFATLPEPSRAAGGQIAARIQARMQADALIDKALAAALAAREG